MNKFTIYLSLFLSINPIINILADEDKNQQTQSQAQTSPEESKNCIVGNLCLTKEETDTYLKISGAAVTAAILIAVVYKLYKKGYIPQEWAEKITEAIAEKLCCLPIGRRLSQFLYSKIDKNMKEIFNKFRELIIEQAPEHIKEQIDKFPELAGLLDNTKEVDDIIKSLVEYKGTSEFQKIIKDIKGFNDLGNLINDSKKFKTQNELAKFFDENIKNDALNILMNLKSDEIENLLRANKVAKENFDLIFDSILDKKIKNSDIILTSPEIRSLLIKSGITDEKELEKYKTNLWENSGNPRNVINRFKQIKINKDIGEKFKKLLSDKINLKSNQNLNDIIQKADELRNKLIAVVPSKADKLLTDLNLIKNNLETNPKLKSEYSDLLNAQPHLEQLKNQQSLWKSWTGLESPINVYQKILENKTILIGSRI